MGIKREEIIAIGDNINDKKMLENAGLGIAMENSSPEVTQIANYVTANNNEDGVAKALKTVIFWQILQQYYNNIKFLWQKVKSVDFNRKKV